MTEAKRRWARWRDGFRERPMFNTGYRVAVAVVGLLVLGAGIVAIPYPGPGWAIVFVGLGILATEFAWARHALAFARRRYDQVMAWFWRQGWWVRVLGVVLTGAVLLATLWLLGALAWLVGVLGIDWPWLRSPLFGGS